MRMHHAAILTRNSDTSHSAFLGDSQTAELS